MSTNPKGSGDDNGRRRPVLIIPGFMSSGLTIERSPQKSWEGKRLWINIASAGFNSLHVGGRLRKNEERRASTRNLAAGTFSLEQNSEEMHQEYLKQVECKSKWVWHMRLKTDMIHEKDGVVARPVPGTAGVDYLAPGALTESMSYVFGPVLKLLKAEGYKEGIDLEACPYDWRIPPSFLESRDKYFANTMKTIEQLYSKSNNTPVLLLCHSMGCKAGHYLLNFVLSKLGKDAGQSWIDKHVHSYVPVGAPHIGAPKSTRGMIDGDKMGLDAFLEKEEGLMLGRSFGSVPWMFPLATVDGVSSTTTQPQSETDASLPKPPPMPPNIVRQQSTLQLTLPEQILCLKHFVHNRKRLPPSKLRLAIQIGNEVIVRTNFASVCTRGPSRSQLYVKFDEVAWLIGCPPTLNQTLQLFPYMQLHLEEPGTGSAPKQSRGIFHLDILWIFRCICCLIEWLLCCPCAVVWKLGCCVVKGAKKGADKAAALLGEVRVIGQSGKVDWKKGVINASLMNAEAGGEEGRAPMMYEIRTKIQTSDPVRYGFMLSKISPETCKVKVRWEPSTVASAPTAVICQNLPKYATRVGKGTFDKKNVRYNSCSSNQLLRMEGMSNALSLLKDTYTKDPVGPLSLSAWQAPPVKKVTAIYGINLPTETAAVYKRNPSIRISMSDSGAGMQQLFVLDKDASLNSETRLTHMIKDGLISETSKTPQKIIGGGVENKSGDGTVPYWSLQHSRSWRDKCDVTIHELEGAEHREILNDKRFHALLLELLGCRNTPTT